MYGDIDDGALVQLLDDDNDEIRGSLPLTCQTWPTVRRERPVGGQPHHCHHHHHCNHHHCVHHMARSSSAFITIAMHWHQCILVMIISHGFGHLYFKDKNNLIFEAAAKAIPVA